VSWRLYNLDGTPLPHDQCPMAIALKEDRAVRGVEAILERPDGTRVRFLALPTPLHDADGNLTGAVNLLVDLNDRAAEETARAYLAAVVASSTDAIVSKDLDGVVTSWNRGAELIFGYTAAEMVGRPIALLFPPDRLTEEDQILARLRRGEQVEHFETVRRHKGGRDVDISVSISPVRDSHGHVIGAAKIARDIGDRKRSEGQLRDLNENLEKRVAERTHELAEANRRLMAEMADRDRSEAALQQAQKMEVVGQLASGVAHDFNNLLAAILGNLELLELRLGDQNLRRLAEAATSAAQRGARLNEQILAFSRKQRLAPQCVNLNTLVLGLEDLLLRTLGGNIEVLTAPDARLWPALVDPHQLELAILNLAINARDAMPSGGRMVIATRNIAASDIEASMGLIAGDYVRVSVTDTGIGMPPEVLARAGEPFFTTKEAGKGSGLGLAQVYGLLSQSGGGTQITSIVGEGTTVDLFVPRSRRAPAKTEPKALKRNGRAGDRTRVLVVDDHEDVREVIAAYLDTLGCSVVQAASGRSAVEAIRANRECLDLLITDYAMPGMSGVELAQAARAACPRLPVVIVTGYVDQTEMKVASRDAIVLMKPFRMHALVAAVEHALQPLRAAVAD
jgi:PAS domain S-box-containing protein